MCQEKLKTYKATIMEPIFLNNNNNKMWSKVTRSKGNKNKPICTFNNSENVKMSLHNLKYLNIVM